MLYDMMRMLWPSSDMCIGRACKHFSHCYILWRTLDRMQAVQSDAMDVQMAL